MKNKTKTYLLLAVVLGIWGTIGYKIINGLSPDVPEITVQEFNSKFNPKDVVEKEVFLIQNVERDPFLGTLTNADKNKVYNSVKAKQPNRNLPSITYRGLIKKQNTTDQVFVVNIKNNQYLLKVGQAADSVKLVKGNIKEIVVRYKNTSQIIKRQ